jgi:tellurite resistance protein TerC
MGASLEHQIQQFLNLKFEHHPLSLWLAFIGLVLFMVVLDLGLFHRKDREPGVRESLLYSAFYIGVALGFGVWVWHEFGPVKGSQYFTGWAIEKSLSLDNIFVISLIFSYLGIPRIYQHRVLFWGILGVLVLRGIMIGGGIELIHRFHWVLYIFAGFLLISGLRMFFADDEPPDIGNNLLLKMLRRILRVTPDLEGRRFFAAAPHRKTGRVVGYVTPLFVALVMVEFADIAFAVDSIPAVLAVTRDSYVIYTSNVLAVVGLRALYFALAAGLGRFHYLRYALSLVLVFIGGKIFAAGFFGLGKIPALVSFAVIFALLGAGIAFSLWKTRRVSRWDTMRYRGGIYAFVRHDND